MARRDKSTFERLKADHPNRKQRRELSRKVAAGDPSLSIVNPNAGGIDVGNESHFAAVPSDRDPNPVREFGCWTADLIRMAEWFVACRIDTVAIQATGVYWIALDEVLTKHNIRVVLVNARNTKNVPGRKTDVQECQWLMKLHTYGLLRDSFRPAKEMEGVRTIWRLRDRHVAEAGRAVQHMQKALTGMNIQLANAISDITGVSGLKIVNALLAGERDPYVLADLRDKRVKAGREEVARSLEGTWRDDLLFELQQALNSYLFIHQQMEECDRRLEDYLKKLPSVPQIPLAAEHPQEAKARKTKTKKPKSSKARDNQPKISNLEEELTRICGVNLCSIDGISVITAQTIVAEVGTNMKAFESEKNFTSWLGLTPGKDFSGGVVVGKGKRKVKNRVAEALRMAATTLLRSDSYLGARYRHLRRQLPSKKAAVKAMARHLGELVYRLFTRGQAWVDRGAAQYEKRRKEMDFAKLTSLAVAKGFQLVPIAQAS
jgi:transposase